MLPEGVIFDLDDTLYDDYTTAMSSIEATAAAFREQHGVDPVEFRKLLRPTAKAIWYQSPMGEMARRVGMSSWEGLWMRFYRDDDESKKMRQWLTGYRLQAWGTTLRELGQDEGLAGPMSDYFQEDRRRRHLVYEDVVPCLERLSGRYKLGLLTNGVVDLQQEKIDGSKLGPYFDAQVISGEIDVGKPDKRVFDLALDRLELNASQVVMVGNSLTSDIAGGKGAGIRSIWLNRTGEANSGDIRPDATIAALDDLDRHLA